MPYTNIFLTPDLHKRSQEYGEKNNMSMAEVIRRSLEMFLPPEVVEEPTPQVNNAQEETSKHYLTSTPSYEEWYASKMTQVSPPEEEVTAEDVTKEPDLYQRAAKMLKLFRKK